MRFSKAEMLEVFERRDAAYRLAIIASHWIRDHRTFKPTSVDEARGMFMEVDDQWIDFMDIAAELERDPSALSGELVMNQLHTTIRASFEVLRNYCEDYDALIGTASQRPMLENANWYVYAVAVRNAVSHNFRFRFRGDFRKRLPTTWNGMTITADMDGKPLEPGTFWHRQGYALFLAMHAFAKTLPAPPAETKERSAKGS
jgi:hypothetical protein